MSTEEWINVCSCKVAYLATKGEGLAHGTIGMDLDNIVLSKRRQSQKVTHTVWFRLDEMSRISKPIGTGRRFPVAKGLGLGRQC